MTDATDITPELLRQLLDYDPDTGDFTWKYRPDERPQWNARCAGKKAGHLNKVIGYVTLRIFDKGYYAHRVAYAIMTGEWPPKGIDHINGDKSDNRWCNIRAADQSQNGANRGLHPNNTSGFRGVHFSKRDQIWVADLCVKGKNKRLGRFKTAEAAYAAYKEAKLKAFGEFARVE